MYLSEVHLVNWRSYRDARFKFKAPTKRRPLVLIGAMNGHGKTSFLLSLYLGLFGRFGLRHAEGFATHDANDLAYYRDAIARFRRNSATTDDPTVIDLTFSPTRDEQDVREIRVVRRWFFTTGNRLRQGDGFEERELHVNGTPVRIANDDEAVGRIERNLFPACFMPAFVFDGEQAQTLINNAGGTGISKHVEVLFGTRILEDAAARVKAFINTSRNRMGGAKAVTAQERALNEHLDERERLETQITDLEEQIRLNEQRRTTLEQQQQSLSERLTRLGGASREKLAELHAQTVRATEAVRSAEDELTEQALAMGTGLAISRLAPTIVNRLNSEHVREQWEGLQKGTMDRADEVLAVAMPEPAESDDLLGHLSATIRQRVKERFRQALAQIYQPPPPNCASEYRLGHVKGELRQRLLELLGRVQATKSSAIHDTAKRLKDAREQRQDFEARRMHFDTIPQEAQELSDSLKEVTSQIAECSRNLGGFDRDLRSKRATLDALNATIGQLQEQLASLEPDQKRIAVAERLHRAIETICSDLRPRALRRMQELVTSHFTGIADRRFRNGRIEFGADSAPILRVNGQAPHRIDVMSGFERRAFGIAFSLALAEMTQQRLPLIIDTPLGNADTEYRPRLLQALTGVDLDQIIVLTHDAEITKDLMQVVRPQLQQTMLVQYDEARKESDVQDGAFFHGIAE